MPDKIGKDKIVAEIQRVSNIVEPPLTATEFDRIASISRKTCSKRFGSWNKAKQAAGVETLARGSTKEAACKKSRSEKARCIKAVQEYSPCHRCGENYPAAVMDYHHVDDNKEKGVVQMAGYRWSRIKSEMRKTVILCANCHRIVEHVES